MKTHIEKNTPIKRTPRVLQVESLFDVPISERSSESWDVDLPIEEKDWRIGLIVGPSGCGKSTIARELFGVERVRTGYTDWPSDVSLVDAMPRDAAIKTITATLGSVGFGSPPNWLRPYAVLSVGEQFRATAARALLEEDDLVVLDEFTSVVDRQVAQIASHSIQKAVRRTEKKRLVAVTCHYDVLDWLQPDWVYQPHAARFEWRYLSRRPEVLVRIHRTAKTAWPLFAKYHYLSHYLNPSSHCFGMWIGDEMVAFNSYSHFPHPVAKNIKVGLRLVVRPDYQGLGLGGRFDDWLGQYLYEQGMRYHSTVAHPAMIAYYARSPRWQHLPTASLKTSVKGKPSLKHAQGQLRRLNTATFAYVPPVERH